MFKLEILRPDETLWTGWFNSSGEASAFLDTEKTRSYWNPSNVTTITDITPVPTEEELSESKLNIIRAKRNDLLRECDYLMMSDYPIDSTAKTAWETYRQALRDMPNQVGLDLDEPVYPEKPA